MSKILFKKLDVITIPLHATPHILLAYTFLISSAQLKLVLPDEAVKQKCIVAVKKFQYMRLVTYYVAISPPLTLMQIVSYPYLSPSPSFLQ